MITVIGATGNVGRPLVDMLRAAGKPVRILTRKEGTTVSGVERVVGDLRDAAVLERAFAGAERVFWVLAVRADPPPDDRAVIEQARRAGVRHVVLLSSLGAEADVPLGRYHGEREAWIKESGLAFTFLRPGYFMSNVFGWAPSIRAAGRVFAPVPDDKVVPVAPRDIAAVGARALLEPGHEGQIYPITGAELLSVREQVAILSGALERPLELVEISIDEAADRMRKAGAPGWIVDSMARMWRSDQAGLGPLRVDTVARLTGGAPETFAAWCVEHRAAFAGG